MNFSQILKPIKINLDKTPKALSSDESFYLLNHEVNNPQALKKATPMNGNYLACEMDMPAGENYNVGRMYSKLTNEVYSWHYNSNGVNYIQRINGDGECEVVYEGCLPLSADPKHEITKFRAMLDVDYLCNKVPGGVLKRLIWVDGTETPMGSLDVEASIATNFFTTPFFDISPNECAPVQMCVPEPSDCLRGEWVPFTENDIGLTNKMIDRALKFAYRDVYYDGRASEFSEWSSLYYQDARGCFDNGEGFARCMKFIIPLGNPLVERKEFYFSEDGGLTWFLSDTIEKYKPYNSNQQYWYQRELSEVIAETYNEDDGTFEYIFCNDKQRISIDPVLLKRAINPIPREAQGLFRLKDSIAVYNYKIGNCPIDKYEASKFQIDGNCTDTPCETDYVNVTARAIIYSDVIPSESDPDDEMGMGGYIFRNGGAIGGAIDDETDPAWFGTGFQILDQHFADKTRNFIAYIEGTDYWLEMDQWKASSNFTNKSKVGVISGVDGVGGTRKALTAEIRSGNFYYQECVFSVPRGMKGYIRLVSHHQISGAGANQNTSTSVVGVLPQNGLKSYNGIKQLTQLGIDDTVKELYFDTCNGAVDNFDAFVVKDETFNDDGGYSGYITDGNDLPVEGAQIYIGASHVATTDFNGFYSFHNNNGILAITVYVEMDCGAFQNVGGFTGNIDIDSNQMGHFDYQIPSEIYRDQFYINVNVSVNNCTGEPVRGVRVAMTGSKYKITDVNGAAHFRLRNYASRTRVVRGIVMDGRNCLSIDCAGNCNFCMPATAETNLPACFQGIPPPTMSIVTPSINTEISDSRQRGLKKGGRYPFGFIVEGDCGKLSAVNEVKYIDIPMDAGFCNFTFNANNIQLPLWAKRIKIVRGKNLKPYYLQWLVDSIERTANGRIKLTIQSLNDYNSLYNFKTNTAYKFLPGDRVEFIRNGDGTLFNSDTTGPLNYQILNPFNDAVLSGISDDPDYFNQIVIVDDARLDNLKEGAVIELQSAAITTDVLTYFSVCASIPVVNGLATIQTGTFDTFDTYLVSRAVGNFSPQLFESKTPSDFWGGTEVDDLGKVHFVNQFENEQRYGRNISVNAVGQTNYFGDLVKKLDAAEQGDIIAISVKDDKIGLALCENDSFLFQISDGLLRIGDDNVVRAAPKDSFISNPDVRVSGEYGVAYEDIGSIFFGDGFAFFCDQKNNIPVIHNFQIAQEAGIARDEDGTIISSCSSFFMKRMRDKEVTNAAAVNILDHLRYSVGQNNSNGVLFLTLKSLRHPGINNEKSVYAAPNDTILYNPFIDTFLGFASFTAEGYSILNLKNRSGCAFVSYQNGLPYIHPIIAETWNTFFGIQCDWFVGVTVNQFNDKIKVPVAMELQSDTMFFASSVTTDKPTFLSEIPPARVKQNKDNKWNAAFLNDINSRGGLFNGTRAVGYYTKVLLVRDNTIALQYNTIDNSKRQQYSELDNIHVKFLVSEQSGFTENL